MSSLSDDQSSQSSLFSSASSRKFNNQFEIIPKPQFRMDEEILEQEEEDSSYIPKKRIYSSVSGSSSSSDSIKERLHLNKLKFQQELRQIKESVISSSQEKSRSHIKRIPSNLYESAKSGTLDLSDTINENKQILKSKNDGIEYRIKRLEQELCETIRSKQSESKLSQSEISYDGRVVNKYSNAKKVDRKINFDQPGRFDQLDQETNFINQQIEKIKKQVEAENKIEEQKRKKLRRDMQYSKIKISNKSPDKGENDVSQQRSEIKQIELHLMQEIDKLKQDNDQLRNMFKNNTNIVEGHQIQTLKKVISNHGISKLDKEIEILKQVERIRSKLKTSIARKLSNEKTKQIDQKSDFGHNSKRYNQNASYLLHKGIPTTYLDA